MADLSHCEDIIIKVSATISECTGRVGWIEELTNLHEYLRDRAEDGEIYKVSKPCAGIIVIATMAMSPQIVNSHMKRFKVKKRYAGYHKNACGYISFESDISV